MGAFKDYEDLPWSHPLKRLAEFRTDEEKLPGNDWMFCSRMGITQNQRLRMYKEPDLIRVAELIEIGKRLKLSDAKIHWIIAAGLCKERKNEEPPSVLEYLNRLLQTDVKHIFAYGAPVSLMISLYLVWHTAQFPA